MMSRARVGRGLVLVGLLIVMAGCPTTPPRIRPPRINSLSAGRKALEMYDTNKDGRLTGDELDECPGLKAALSKVDPGNRGVTAAMITVRIKKWQKSKLGRMSLACTVLRNGQGLDGAEVRFVPETFLGEHMIVASGKTDQNGMAMLSVPTDGTREDPPGVPPGFYRVEITKHGMTIPDKYNKKTILGQEVANDAKGIQEGIKFELEFQHGRPD